MWKIRILITSFLVAIQIFIFAQEFTPIVNHYSKKDYNASNQNWDVKQAADGKMCFGNNQGLLQFDGSNWKVYKIPGNKIIRSLFISSDLSLLLLQLKIKTKINKNNKYFFILHLAFFYLAIFFYLSAHFFKIFPKVRI